MEAIPATEADPMRPPEGEPLSATFRARRGAPSLGDPGNDGPRSRRRILLAIATACVYGPFAAMTLFTRLFVRCAHCKRTTALLLPVGPGFLPLFAANRALFRSGHLDEWLGYGVAAALSLFFVWIVSRGLRRAPFAVGVLATAIFSGLAYILLGLIRA